MRLFVAVYPAAQAAEHLQRTVASLAVGRAAGSGANVRLAPRANWHITLAFIGEVPDEHRPRAEAALARAVDAFTSGARAGPIRLRIAGGGRFGRGRFTILWTGLGGDVQPLRRLGRAIRRELRQARLPVDERPFRPHLTLARPGDRIDVGEDLAALRSYEGPPWTVGEVVLMRAHPGPKPTYDRLAAWPL